MQTLNCDQVFDVLTRGPFPTGEPIDRPVERHLACCHECRALAEALRPAVELFHEAVGPEDARDLPGYHGCLAPASRGLAQMVADAIDAEEAIPARRRTVQLPKPAWWEPLLFSPYRFVGALAAGALLALSLWSLADNGIPPASGPVLASYSPDSQGLQQLVALRLPDSCKLPAAGEFSSSNVRCCTECHAAKDASTANHQPRLMAALVNSCQLCHVE